MQLSKGINNFPLSSYSAFCLNTFSNGKLICPQEEFK